MGTASVMLKRTEEFMLVPCTNIKGCPFNFFRRYGEGYSLPLPYVTPIIVLIFSGIGIPRLGDFWGIPRKKVGFFKKTWGMTPFRIKF